MSRTDLDTWEDKQAAKCRKANDVAFTTKLGAAKHALALAEALPDIVELIDNTEAIRAAAKAKHISAEGINAWTRFVIDAEREGWKRIKAMQDASELPKHGGDRKSSPEPRGLKLTDLIASQRSSEWATLSKLTEVQLNEMERIANEEDRLLTRSELLRLSKAGTLMPSKAKEPKPRSAEATKIIEQARGIAAAISEATQHKLQIDDDAKVTRTERGAWVANWLWVEDELTRSDLEE